MKLGGLTRAAVFLFLGARYWYVLVALHLLVLLPLSAVLTAFQVSMCRTELRKIPEPPEAEAEAPAPDGPAASPSERLTKLSQALAAHEASARKGE